MNKIGTLTSRDVAMLLIFLEQRHTSMAEGLKYMRKCDPTVVRIGDSYRIEADTLWNGIKTDRKYSTMEKVTSVETLAELQGAALNYFLQHGEEQLFY